MDIEKMSKRMADLVKRYIDKSILSINDRLSDIEARNDESILDVSKKCENLFNEVKSAIPNVKDGADGKSVTIEDVRPAIKEVVEERVSIEFSKIKLPEDGRDAFDIEILEGIISEKNYPRGIYATHNGGLWKSVSQTNGMNGWLCIIDGISKIDIDYDGERKSVIRVEKASGSVLEKSIKIPSLIDKGVYSQSNSYEKGDGLTYGGSYWIVQKDNPEGSPGSSNDFRLAVKRGRDGKEVVKVEKPETVKVSK